MTIASTGLNARPADAGSIAALAESDGCASHPVVRRLTGAGVQQRDLADAVHALCAIHGRATRLFDEAGQRLSGLDEVWLTGATRAFAAERAYLARLTALVGPLPSTPGQAESDGSFAAQRHAFDMLARSDRSGCATGAALALMIDWHAFRLVLDAAARRAGIDPEVIGLPTIAEITAIATLRDAPPATRRAMAFGAQQTFAQHRGLCDLIEARAVARDQL